MSKRPCPKELSYDDIKNSLERHTSYEAGKQMLVVLMSAGEVAVTSAKLSLKCKLKNGRIEVPVRSVHCHPHLECVDLRAYLDWETKNTATIGAASSTSGRRRPLWACPVIGNARSVPSHTVEHLLKQSKAFQGSLAAGTERRSCSRKWSRFSRTNATRLAPCVITLPSQAREQVVDVYERPPHVPNNEHTEEHEAAAKFGYDLASVKSWRKKETAYEKNLYVRLCGGKVQKKNRKNRKKPNESSQHERHEQAFCTILKRLKEDMLNV